MTESRTATPHEGAAENTNMKETISNTNASAKVSKANDLYKVLQYFRYKVGTTLDCAQDTGILRNSITYYVAYLESIDEIQAICKKPDKTTGYLAKHYSSNKALWAQEPVQAQEPSLFDDKSLWE